MASITFWSQLAPSPRAPSVAESLAARVRDPAWFLARQWQLGEFQGADAGSPSFTRISSHTAPLATTQIDASALPLGPHALLEPLVEAEPFTPDAATRVEIGQSFEALLTKAGVATAVRDQFRAAYPIGAASTTADADTAAFLRICAGRAVDGVALYAAAKTAAGQLPAQPGLDATSAAKVQPLMAPFLAWVESTWGAPGTGEPPAWDATRLEYAVDVTARSSGGGTVTLAGTPDSLAELDWYSFDAQTTTADTPAVTNTSVIPGNVRFRGMPNARWWDFEGSKTDFGAVVPDIRDLGKLLFMDFLLLHGDDWFLAPLDVPTGSLVWIDAMVVTDVFGVATTLTRADSATWHLFAQLDAAGTPAPFLVVPAVASASLVSSAPLEEVHLLRDETADMAWAVEHVVEGPIGQALREPPPPSFAPLTDVPAALAYQLATPLPATWYPLLPQQQNGAVVLLAGTYEGETPPRGRIMHRLSAPGFQMPDAEVPRSGVRVQRVACRARSCDGAMHLWIARRTQFGAGAASSGLRYDVATDV